MSQCFGECVNDELGYLAEIPKYSVDVLTCFPLAAYSKLREESSKLKWEFLGKKGTNIWSFGKFPDYLYCKN